MDESAPEAATFESEERPALEPAPSFEGLGAKIIVALIAVNAAGMAWLAVRNESDDSTRRVLDGMAQILVGAGMALIAYRILVRFAFRILDLMTMVIVLGTGVMVSIDALKALADMGMIWSGAGESERLAGQMLAVLLMSSFLMGGAALGLRYCKRMKLERPLLRVWAVVNGMLAVPATAGTFAFPLAFLGEFAVASLESTASTQRDKLMFAYLFCWIVSVVLTFSNGFLFLRSLSNETGVEVGAKD